jgi:hypothetical protein
MVIRAPQRPQIEALQQRGSFAGGAGAAVKPVCIGVGGQQFLVLLELFPADVAGVCVRDQSGPLLAREIASGGAPVRGLAGPALSIDERTGIARVVQGAQHSPVGQLVPCQLTFAGSFADPAGEEQSVTVKGANDRARGPGSSEGAEQVTQRVLDGLVGIEHDLAGRVADQPDGERHRQFAAAGFGQDPALEPGADEVQLGL